MDEATDFVNLIRKLVIAEIEKRDKTVPCIVDSVNADGTLNLYVLPDTQNIIKGITNQCRFDFVSGDMALLYLVENKLNNAFVIAKYNPVG